MRILYVHPDKQRDIAPVAVQKDGESHCRVLAAAAAEIGGGGGGGSDDGGVAG